MKYNLIGHYYDALPKDKIRIEQILWKRYKYDIALKFPFN